MDDQAFRRFAVAVGLTVGVVVSGSYAVGASSGPGVGSVGPSATAAAEEEPDRVTGASMALDAMEAGATVGPGIANGIAATLISSQQLPPPGDQLQMALLTAVSAAAQQMAAQAPQAIGALRPGLAPLACTNDASSGGIDALAGGLDSGAQDFGEVIQPFDVTARELALLLRAGRERQPDDC